MIQKRIFAWSVFAGLVLLWGCSTGDNGLNYSGNVKSTLNVTGNYEVKRTPLPSLNNFTITQTNNLIQAVSNDGVVYKGTTPGDLETVFSTEDGTGISTTGSSTITTSMTLQGTDGGGTVRTLLLTSITFYVEDPFSTTGSSSITTAVKVTGLAGTYTDSGGVNGAIEMVSNTL
ncbi:MAG: hypothetical protein HYS08_08200 [Chlamydiae bacterium]|nr:hypothetical protein [Chlamydiota bacterium]MBI3266026.1 hypothetical protein [Chlamydiota bacterium]